MTEEDLLAAGYRKYSGSHSNADRFYQRTIRSPAPDGRTRSGLIRGQHSAPV